MKEVLNWITTHWDSIVAALGIGGASGIAGKKLIDREQNQKIKYLESKVDNIEKEVQMIEKNLAHNSLVDEQFRSEFKDHKESIKGDLHEIRSNLKMVLNHLLANK